MGEQLEKYFQGELSASERLAYLKRVESDSELKRQFIEYKNTRAITALSDQTYNDKEGQDGYIRFMKRLRTRKIYRIALKTTGYAAVIALLIISTHWFAFRELSTQPANSTMNTLYVPAGQRINLTLPDGTGVWLNAQTTLSYQVPFQGDERRVTIDGEAYFEVAKDAKKPFIVSSQGVEMKVLGTTFNVCSYSHEKKIQTSLIEGSLKVYYPKAESKGVVLKANEQVVIQSGRMALEKITHPDYFLWKDGIYCFQKEVLSDVLKKLELYYDV
ncbi:MAG: FecR domain-containing protein, partial [Tannerella sp.]|nr:FecR domain-containing protein [Tannerella sp.]